MRKDILYNKVAAIFCLAERCWHGKNSELIKKSQRERINKIYNIKLPDNIKKQQKGLGADSEEELDFVQGEAYSRAGKIPGGV